MAIRWIFFDVGGTLSDESEAYAHRAREMLSGTGISLDEYDRTRLALAREGKDGNSAVIAALGLKKTPWHPEDEVPFADARPTLAALSARGYRLGVIANQVAGLRERLAAWGLLPYFEVVISSADVGAAKPSPDIFRLALESAGCPAAECVMVGDRLDNDIRPAKALGMRTVWVRSGLARHQAPSLGNGVADWQIEKLSELLEIMK